MFGRRIVTPMENPVTDGRSGAQEYTMKSYGKPKDGWTDEGLKGTLRRSIIVPGGANNEGKTKKKQGKTRKNKEK